MELWDIYDNERKKTGKIKERGKNLNKDEFHLVVHVCIFNSKGELLIQQRQSYKDDWPDMWDVSAAGSALTGESSTAAAERELFEEIGCRKNLGNERPYFTINCNDVFDDFYLIKDDIDPEDLILQKDEVKNVKWASKEEILKLHADGKFIPYHTSLLCMIFDMMENRGSHSL